MDHGLAIEVIPDGTEVTLALKGDMDEPSARVLRSCIESLDDRWRSVVLDMAGVSFIDSGGIAMLLQASEDLELDFRLLQLRNVHVEVQRVFELAGATEFIPSGPTF